MRSIPEEKDEVASLDSRASRPIDDVVGARAMDPRKKQTGKLTTVKESNREGGYLNKEAL